MNCPEREALLVRRREATNNFTCAVRDFLEARNGTAAVFRIALGRSEQARLIAEKARLEFEVHVLRHGCANMAVKKSE